MRPLLSLRLVPAALLLSAAPLAASPPNAPTGVIAYAPNQSRVHVAWEDRSGDEDGFRIQRQINGGPWISLATVPADFLVHRSVVAPVSATYRYRVQAYRAAESSVWVESPLLEKPTGDLDLFSDVRLPDVPGQASDDFEIPEGSGTRVGEAMSYTVPVFQGTPTRFLVTRDSLPSGLAFDENTGTLTKLPPYSTPDTSQVHRLFVGVEFDGGKRFEQVHFLRVLPAPSTPEIVGVPSPSEQQLATSRYLDLSTAFRDPARPYGAWFYTGGQSIIVALHHTATPVTVANFLGYASRRDYDGTFVHRAVADFIFQGGGYGPASANASPHQWAAVAKRPRIFNEPGLSNLPGTIAMAKSAIDRDTATSEWFFNVGDANPANLDYQNGGFAAFGSIVGSTGHAIAELIANDTVKGNYAIQVVDQGSGAFYGVPVLDPIGGSPPPSLTANSLLAVDTVAVVPPVVLSLVSNSDPDLLDASVVGPLIRVASKGLAGSAQLTVRATNLDGNSVDLVLPLTFADLLGPRLRLLSLRGLRPVGTILLRARATDTVRLGSWRYRLNGRRWITGGRLTGASAVFTKKIRRVKKGRNRIEIEAFDARRNSSGLVRKTFRYR